MSAMSSPAPARSPEQPTPVVVPAPPVRPKSRRWIVLLLCLIAIVAGGAVSWRWLAKPARTVPAAVASARTAKAFVGPLDITLRLAGTTSARTFANITAPMLRGPSFGGGLVLLELAKAGSFVRKGDIVAKIDAQMLRDRIDDIRDTVAGVDNDVKKRAADQKVEWETMQQTLRVAQASWDKAKLDYSAGEVKTEIERELLKLSMDEAEARYKEQAKDVAFRKASQTSELRVLEINAELQKRRFNHFADNLERFTIKTPMDGLVVMASTFRGGEMGQVQLGDQVGSGQQIMKVVDPRSMQVEATVSQTDSGSLRVGQHVKVGFDAFPEMKLSGKVYSIGALAVSSTGRQNDWVRGVPVRVAIEAVDPRLIPDLSAYANVVLETIPSQLQVPAGAVRIDHGKTLVSVKRGQGFEPREVTIGKRSNTHIAIVAGLSAGDEVRVE